MRVLKLFVLAFFAAALTASHVLTRTVNSQSDTAMEAPAGFDNKTNGFTPQPTFEADRAAFEDREEIADGLGPVYNAQACAECLDRLPCLWAGVDNRQRIFSDQINVDGPDVKRRGQ